MASTFTVFCDPAQGQTLRYDVCGANPTGTIGGTACCSAILGGPTTNSHTNNGDLSVILMGDSNAINTFGGVHGRYNTVANGTVNNASGFFVNIFNGDTNNNEGCFTNIFNGTTNNISIFGAVDSCYNTIGNGDHNEVYGNFSTILNGNNNCITGNHSLIGGGRYQ